MSSSFSSVVQSITKNPVASLATFALGAVSTLALAHLGLYPNECKITSQLHAHPNSHKKPKIVVVTGAAGQIGYSIIFQIAQGKLYGNEQPIELRLLDLPVAMNVLNGVVMELEDCAYPLLSKVVPTSSPDEAFKDAEAVFLIGAVPRGPGMERRDLLAKNANIFRDQGQSLNRVASRNVKVLVVGNPANTNALIAMKYAPDLPKTAFTAMTRLDQNRAKSQISRRANVNVSEVQNVIIWGNHSGTQYPDVSHATIHGQSVKARVNDNQWVQGDFISTVQKRGGAIIDALKKSSAASAANAALDHMRDWIHGTAHGEYVSMGVISDGNKYGVKDGLIFSFPCTCSHGQWKIVEGLNIDEFSRAKLTATEAELVEEAEQAFAGHQ